MKNVMRFASKVLFFILLTALIALNASYGLSFVSRLFPENLVIQFASLLLFDGGAVIWFLIFLYGSDGSGQRGTAILATILDLVGAALIAFAEIFTAGSAYIADPVTVAALQKYGTYALGIWTISNVVLTYIFHVTDPKMQEEIKARNVQDVITDRALSMTEQKVEAISSQLADELSDAMRTRILASLQVHQSKYLASPQVTASMPELPEMVNGIEGEGLPEPVFKTIYPTRKNGHKRVFNAQIKGAAFPNEGKPTK